MTEAWRGIHGDWTCRELGDGISMDKIDGQPIREQFNIYTQKVVNMSKCGSERSPTHKKS